MVVEKLSKSKITVSFSGTVGKKGLDTIKNYIEAIEGEKLVTKKVPQQLVNQISREINKDAWEKLKATRGIKSE